jgi:iron complex outermembrane recepter protein
VETRGIWGAAGGIATLAIVLCCSPSTAQTRQLDIPAGHAGVSIPEFARQAEVSVIARGELLRGVVTPAVHGNYEAVVALQLMLKGAGLTVSRTADGVLMISPSEANRREEQEGMSLGLRNSTSVFALVLGVLSSAPAHAQDADSVETITVTGFRATLQEARDIKRRAINEVESIVAEDIGKMPDLNLAESIQRLPGVAMTREGGEGRSITLRGFSADFTRTTLNGMEVPSSADGLDSGGVTINASRSFDFNIFAAELFNRVDVQKTQRSSMEEGGMAGTVDLYTARPFDFNGLAIVGSAEEGYNTLTHAGDPRVAVMVSDTFAHDKLGILVSLAMSKRTVHQEGWASVRWTSPYAAGDTWNDTNTTVTGTPSDYCGAADALNCVYSPNLPRADFFGNAQKRIGLTTSIQYRPVDGIQITFDALHSELDNVRTNYNSMEWLLTHGTPGNYTGQTPVSMTIAANGKQLEAATFTDVTSWYESRLQNSVSMFNQYALSGEWKIDNHLTFTTMTGYAQAKANRTEVRPYYRSIPHDYSFDFSGNSLVPTVSFGSYDPNLGSNYVSAITGAHRNNFVDKENFTTKADLIYKADAFSMQVGIDYNDRMVQYAEGTGNSPSFDPSNYTKAFPVSDFGHGLPGGAKLSTWAVADFDALFRDGIYTNVFTPDPSKGWTVDERTVAGYVELNTEFDVAGMRLRANSGVRYVHTSLKSSAILSGTPVTVNNTYDNYLPSLNLALEVTDDVVARFSYARSMTRPGLSTLNIAAPVFGYNGRTVGNIGNPDLKPYESNDIDLSLEWYMGRGGLLAVGLFNKDMVTSLTTQIVTKMVPQEYWAAIYADPQYDPSYNADPANVAYTWTIPANREGGNHVQGVEVTFNQPFTFMPDWFNFLPQWVGNFGIASNYTYVSAQDSTGLSPNSYNYTVYYDQGNFGVRLSVNQRDDYLISEPGGNGNAQERKYGPTQVDFAAFYNITDNVTVRLEGVNITDEIERIYDTGDGTMNTTRELSHTGAQWFVGVRYRY